MADLKILTGLSASAGAAVSGSAGLVIQQGGVNVSAGGVTITGGDLRLNNNAIKSSGGSTAITLNSTDVKTEGDLIVGAGHIKVGTNTESIILDASGRADFQVGVRVTGSTVTSGSLTVGGGGSLQVTNGSISGSSTLQVGGASTLAGGVTVTGGALNANTVEVSASALSVGGGYGSTGVTISSAGAIQANGALTVDGASTLTGDVTFGGNIVADANENKSIFAAVTSNTITVGAAGATVSIPGTASVGGNLTVTGDFTVYGTTTTVSSQNVTIKDKNVILAVPDGGAAATDAGADGGGITLSGSTDKTFQWSNATDSWTSSEHIDLASGKTFKIATVDVVKQTTFSQGVDNNSFAIDVTGSQLVSGSSTNAYVGIGAASVVGFGSIGDAAILKGNAVAINGGNILKLESSGTFGEMGGITIGAYGSGETITLTGSAGKVTLEQLVSVAGGGTSNVSVTNYYNVRSVVSGTKQPGTDTVTFTLTGPVGKFGEAQSQGGATPTGVALSDMSASTAAGLIQKLGGMSFDVATRDTTNQIWSNDLVAVQLTASLSSSLWYPQVIVSAPSLADYSQVRLIAVNETKNVIV